jgi:hypothetical protein
VDGLKVDGEVEEDLEVGEVGAARVVSTVILRSKT